MSTPQATDAEKSILGAVLLDERMFDQLDTLKAEDFYHTGHTTIFEAMAALRLQSHAIDLITLTDELSRRNELDRSGGVAYIASLTDGVPRRPSVEQYVRIVREKSAARRAVTIARRIEQRLMDDGDSVQTVIGDAEAQLFDVVEGRAEKSFLSPGQIVREQYGSLEGFYQRGEKSRGLASGFPNLTTMIGGYRRSELIVVAARPSMGKTAFVMQEGSRLAITHRVPVGVFSLEMSRAMLLDRMVSNIAEVDLADILSGSITRTEAERCTDALDQLVNAPLYIDDTRAVTILEMRGRARRLARTVGRLGLIIVDYLQLMSGTAEGKRGFDSRTQEISSVSRGLKILAGEADCPVVAVSQLNRAVEQRGRDNEPRLSDLRESGTIEQDADLVIFPHRPEYYDRDKPELKGLAKMIVAKQRNGPTGSVELGWQHRFARFIAEAPQHAAAPVPISRASAIRRGQTN